MKTTRLAVVMFIEISDFARMTSENESRAIELLDEHRGIATPLIHDHDGTIVDQDSGGMLVLFESALSAAQCALLIQFSLRARNTHAAGLFKILPRIGLHLGDIWQEGDRVYGNGVNIASRVMNKARPGGICVSDDVYRQLVNKMEVEFCEVYDSDLKNISRSLALYELATGCETGKSPEQAPKTLVETEIPPVPETSPPPTPQEARSAHPADGLGAQLEKLTQRLVESTLQKASIELSQDTDQIQVNIHSHPASNIQAAHRRKDKNHPARRMEELIKKNKSSSGALTTGIILGGAFGAGLYFLPSGWWWVGICIGGLSAFVGLVETIGSLRELRRLRKQMPKLIQEALLSYARKADGNLSVADAAAATRFSLDEVRRELETMADKGYVARETDEDGLILYRFSGKKKSAR